MAPPMEPDLTHDAEEDPELEGFNVTEHGPRNMKQFKKKALYLKSALISMVIGHAATTYPFFALVQNMRTLHPESFMPCTEKPCHFTRFFPGGGVPGTFPDWTSVQNGVKRPFTILGESLVAYPVEYRETIPRCNDHFYAFGSGFLHYSWPEFPSEGSTVTTEGANDLWAVCFMWICVDSDVGISVGSMGNLEYAMQMVPEAGNRFFLPDNATKVNTLLVPDKGDQLILSNMSVALQQSIVSNNPLVRASFFMSRWGLNVYSDIVLSVPWLVAWLKGKELGSEYLVDARCPGKTKKEMIEMCKSTEIKAGIVNPLAKGAAVILFMASLVFFFLIKVVHDALVLFDMDELHSLRVGWFMSVSLTACVASGMMSAVGASEVFLSPITIGDGANPCGCYYNLEGVRALVMMVVPHVMLYTYMEKRKLIAQTFMCGDLLYFKTFTVPHHVVRQNVGWMSHQLMLPRIQAHAADDATDQEKFYKANIEERIKEGHELFGYAGMFHIPMMIVVVLVDALVVPRVMMLMYYRLQQQQANPYGPNTLTLRLLMKSLPFMLAGAAYFLTIIKNKGNINEIKGLVSQLWVKKTWDGPRIQSRDLSVCWRNTWYDLMFVPAYCLSPLFFWPPMGLWGLDTNMNEEEMHVQGLVWMVGGFCGAIVFFKMLDAVFGPRDLLTALILKDWQAGSKVVRRPGLAVVTPYSVAAWAESNANLVTVYGLSDLVAEMQTYLEENDQEYERGSTVHMKKALQELTDADGNPILQKASNNDLYTSEGGLVEPMMQGAMTEHLLSDSARHCRTVN